MSLFILIACVLLFLAGFGFHVARWPNLHFGWLGMAFWALSILLPVGVPVHLGLEWVIVIALVIVVVILLVRPKGV